jgi:DNA repair photolyase
MTKRRTGTKEWSDKSLAICRGCPHNCKYCWARANALRYKQIKSPEEWKTPFFYKRLEKPYKVKRIMFPSTHDIQIENVDKAIQFIIPWLDIGNEVLIVSKPHLECVERLCRELQPYQDQITFRFTIGSIQQETLDFWEYDAPSFEERMKCLRFAFESGWKTSVSSEPYLDHNISLVAEAVLPYITDTIWIGKMNDIPHRVITAGWTEKDFKFLDIVKDCQTDDFIKQLYSEWKNNPKIRWKDSCKSVLGLPEEKIG